MSRGRLRPRASGRGGDHVQMGRAARAEKLTMMGELSVARQALESAGLAWRQEHVERFEEVPLFFGYPMFFLDTTFREGGAFLGTQKPFSRDPKNFSRDPKNFSRDPKLFSGNKKLSSGYIFFWGIQRLFSGYKKKMLTKIQKHHENYINTKLSFFKNVVFSKRKNKEKRKNKSFFFFKK